MSGDLGQGHVLRRDVPERLPRHGRALDELVALAEQRGRDARTRELVEAQGTLHPGDAAARRSVAPTRPEH